MVIPDRLRVMMGLRFLVALVGDCVVGVLVSHGLTFSCRRFLRISPLGVCMKYSLHAQFFHCRGVSLC